MTSTLGSNTTETVLFHHYYFFPFNENKGERLRGEELTDSLSTARQQTPL